MKKLFLAIAIAASFVGSAFATEIEEAKAIIVSSQSASLTWISHDQSTGGDLFTFIVSNKNANPTGFKVRVISDQKVIAESSFTLKYDQKWGGKIGSSFQKGEYSVVVIPDATQDNNKFMGFSLSKKFTVL